MRWLLSILLCLPVGAAPLIIDHTSVSLYTNIPQADIDRIKTYWLSIAGESHSRGIRNGVYYLSTNDTRFGAVAYEGTNGVAPTGYTTNGLRVSRGTKGYTDGGTAYTNWHYDFGEEDWFTSNTASNNVKAGLAYCATSGPALKCLGFGWCWDMNWHNDPGGGTNAAYGTRWAGATVDGPEGDLRWGLDSNDYAHTTNSISLTNYLITTSAYDEYCRTNGWTTRVIFTTGPGEDSPYSENEQGWQRAVKNTHIRMYVTNLVNGVLFDYSDILAYADDGSSHTHTWVNHNGVTCSIPVIAIDNKKNFDGTETDADADHIGERGALRLAKAMWYMLWQMDQSQYHYILDGGTGDGSSWASPLDDLPATLVRGDTYYIGDGLYGSYYFNDAASGGTLITIKKAISTDHGTETGWRADYGNGQATFTNFLRFETSNWLFDGQVGGGPGAWNAFDDYGFRVSSGQATDNVKNIYVGTSGGAYVTNVVVRHTDMLWPANYPTTSNTSQDNFYIWDPSEFITISYCSMRYPSRVHVFLINEVNNVTAEYCYFYWCRSYDDSGVAQHAQSFDSEGNSNVILRHNLFHNNTGTFIAGVLSRAAGIQNSDNWEIYGNVFYDDGARSRYAASDSPICVINDEQASGWKIYNNSFVSLTPNGANGNVGIDFAQGTTTSGGNLVYNNLWYDHRSQDDEANIVFEPGDATSVHDYSYWNNITTYPAESNDVTATGDPFVDHANLDFRLSAATAAGISIDAPHNTDALGTTRGADGTWDRGAYEFQLNTRKVSASGKLKLSGKGKM